MATHLRWLKQQKEKAERDVEEAQQRLQVWTEALRLADEEHQPVSPSSHPTSAPSTRTRSKVSILDLAEKGLREHGPMNSSELQKYLEENGRLTTSNSISTSLNRWRGKKFEKNESRQWCLINEEKEEDGKNKGDTHQGYRLDS